MRRALALAAVLACGRNASSAGPAPLRVLPTGAYRGQPAHVRVWGRSFNAHAVHQLGGGARVDDRFHLRIGGVELFNTLWTAAQDGEQLLEADVPADLAAGTWDVEVEDPAGRKGVLPRAWTEADRSPPQLILSAQMPARVEAGVSFTVQVQLSNPGGEAALLSTLTIAGDAVAFGNPLLSAGEMRALQVPRLASLGPIALAVAAAASDTVTGVALGPASVNLSSVALRAPALVIAAGPLPSSVDVAQPVSVAVRIRNGGEIAARAVTPVFALPSGVVVDVPPAQDIAPGAEVSYAATLHPPSPGALSVAVGAAGTDQLTGATLSTAAQPIGQIQVQRRAALVLRPAAMPVAVDRGQTFSAAVTVQNTGEAVAKGVTATPLASATGGAHATTSTAHAPVDLAAGQSATFSWTYVEDGTAAGTLSFAFTAAGTDANTASSISASLPATSVAVQNPAALSAAWTVPASATVGSSFTATLTVTNPGGATASSVMPSASLVGSGAALSAGPTPPAATIAGGAKSTFTWTVSAKAVGTVQLSAAVTGSDANTSAALSASATSSSIAMDETTLLSSDPFAGDGTTFSYLFSYQGQVYLGPNKTGTGMVRMAPDGSNSSVVNWQLEVDSLTPARNPAYQGTGVLCHTIGFPSCTQGTAQCGPDNESGPGLFISGLMGANEWYVISGASNIGGVRYLYMTNPTIPLATGGYDDLLFMQIQAGQYGSTRMATAGHFFNGKLYLGFYDNGVTKTPAYTAPVLDVLTRTPALPGTIAAAGTDLVNLQATAMPAIGAAGTPANSGQQALMIDAISDFGGVLYLGNNGGLVRSVNGTPGPCTGTCADWVNVTPSASAWTSQTSISLGANGPGGLQPAQRAIPAIVTFGGRLFAARNTTAGPQLFSCAPSAGAQCGPSDWSLVAGSAQLTQLGDPGNTAITLLVASSAHLYVGYNNSTGIQIWRAASAPMVLGDFTGRAGCVAGSPGCVPVGGAGLGNTNTKFIFDGKVFTFGGQDFLYLSVGDGMTAPKVFRIAP